MQVACIKKKKKKTKDNEPIPINTVSFCRSEQNARALSAIFEGPRRVTYNSLNVRYVFQSPVKLERKMNHIKSLT